jgi:hypothetical protein
MKTKAIFKTHPSVVTIRADGAFDAQDNKVEIDMDVVNAWVDPEAYIAKRVAEYPTIGDQLDALWKGGDAQTEMLAKVMAVKAKYPKEQA